MRTWILAILALAVLASGCTGNAATFYEEMVRLGCRFQKKCAKAAFNDQFDDLADCRDEYEDLCSPDDFEDACADYDKDEAKECLSQTREQIRKCEVDENDDACDLTKICGDDPQALQDLYSCMAGGGYDGYDGMPPDATGLSEPWLPEADQLAEDQEEPDEPEEEG
jgi:hypothetical protein